VVYFKVLGKNPNLIKEGIFRRNLGKEAGGMGFAALKHKREASGWEQRMKREKYGAFFLIFSSSIDAQSS